MYGKNGDDLCSSAYCYRCNSKKNRFNKKQEAKGLLKT